MSGKLVIQWIVVFYCCFVQINGQRSYRPRPSNYNIPVTYPVDHWPNCTIGNNIHGTCQKIVQCPEAVVAILRGYHPPICYWERYKTFPLVCCPELSPGESLNDILPGKNGGDIDFSAFGVENSQTCGMTKLGLTSDEYPESIERGFMPTFRLPAKRGSNPHQFPQAKDVKYLKRSEQSNRKRRATKNTKWPWMVSVYNDERGSDFMCNGFLIDDKYILTAAQKFDSQTNKNRKFSVRIGRPDDNGSLYKVSKVTVHSEYKSWAQYNDIAVLELERPVTESGVVPLCLPPGNSNVENISGFNATILGQVTYEEVPIVSHSWCAEMYSKYSPLTYPRGISDEFLCAGLQLDEYPEDGVGDLGGPVMIQVDNHWIAIGMVSLDYKCANQGFPGVYINLAKYANWIRNTMTH